MASRIRALFRILAVVLFLGAVCFWFSRGAKVGWTDYSVPAASHGFGQVHSKSHSVARLHPGLDFLAVTLAGSVLILVVSIRFKVK